MKRIVILGGAPAGRLRPTCWPGGSRARKPRSSSLAQADATSTSPAGSTCLLAAKIRTP